MTSAMPTRRPPRSLVDALHRAEDRPLLQQRWRLLLVFRSAYTSVEGMPHLFRLLGTEGVHGKSEGGTVQALGCMDAFCKPCIATHLHTQKRNGHEPSCPICKRVVPEEEMEECGPPMRLPEAPKAKRPGEGSTAPGSQMGAVAEEEEEVEVVVAHQWGGFEADDPASHLYQPQQQRRESTRQRITSAAVTAAAIVTHAPALLRKSPEHLAAAARSSGSRGASRWTMTMRT